MKTFAEYIKENLENQKLNECGAGCGIFKHENEEEESERRKKIWGAESEEEEKENVKETIKDEKTFRDYAENKFKVVFGDKLDKNKMNETISGLLKDNKELAEKGDWAELVGMLNKSFGA